MTKREPTKSTFTKVPHWFAPLLVSGALKDGAVRVYLALGMFVDWKTGKGAFPSVATLCEVTGMGESTVRRHIKDLLTEGGIERHARFRQNGSQTSSEVWLMEDPPPADDTPRSISGGGGPNIETPIPRAPYQEPSSTTASTSTDPVVEEPPTQVGGSTHLSSDSPPDSPVPNTESSVQSPPAELPLVRRRQLMKAGVGELQMGGWEAGWRMVVSLAWPEWAQTEAANFPDEHLAQHVFQTVERGQPLRPEMWTRFYLDDRVRQLTFLRGRLDQEARMAEDPAEREARQNRSLPPDRSREYPAAGAEA